MIRRPPRSTLDRSSAASDVYKRQPQSLARKLTSNVSKYDYIVGIADHNKLAKKSRFDPLYICLLYTSPSPRDRTRSRMPSSA